MRFRRSLVERTQIAARQRFVADLVARYRSAHDITEALTKAGLFNRRTGRPWNRKTIERDCAFFLAKWAAEATHQVDEYKGEIIQSTRAIIATAWARGDLKLALGGLALLADVVGAKAPVRVQLDHVQKEAERLARQLGLSVDEVLAEADAIVRGK